MSIKPDMNPIEKIKIVNIIGRFFMVSQADLNQIFKLRN
ncbi:protein of unknown function [Methanocaldococcus lauensis]|uniref:Uncharacterized protein n=1 Tax=Methanocaldococcus lauensis TaxID=2546128 RepID=A0A8D6SUR9_9EURY|nr:protein of unknown function [Methanocaldococcus lauensis]